MAATASASKTRRAILVLFLMPFFMGALHHNHYQKTEYISLRGEIEPTRTIYYYYFGGCFRPPRKYMFFSVNPNRQVNSI